MKAALSRPHKQQPLGITYKRITPSLTFDCDYRNPSMWESFTFRGKLTVPGRFWQFAGGEMIVIERYKDGEWKEDEKALTKSWWQETGDYIHVYSPPHATGKHDYRARWDGGSVCNEVITPHIEIDVSFA